MYPYPYWRPARFDPSQTILAGMTTAQLQAALAAAQQAYGNLMMGQKIVQVAYTQGDGNKSVTYNQADAASLMAFIQLLQAQLGIVPRPRQPMRPLFW